MRLFAAIGIDQAVRASLVGVRERLSGCPGVRWSKPENLHLTLRFFGKWPEERLEELSDALSTVERPAMVPVALTGLRFFPSDRSPRAFVAAVEADEALLALQERIEAAAHELGFQAERRAYAPHVTLGRIREPRKARRLVERVREGSWALGSFEALGFALYESRPTPTGSMYEKLRDYNLGAAVPRL